MNQNNSLAVFTGANFNAACVEDEDFDGSGIGIFEFSHQTIAEIEETLNEPDFYRPPSRAPSIQLYAAVAVEEELSRMGSNGEPSLSDTDASQTTRVALLKRMLTPELDYDRPLICASRQMTSDIRAVGRDQPNFKEVTGIIYRAALLSQRTGSPFGFPPLLLVGVPGIGKTRYARAIARALQTSFTEIAMNCLDDTGTIIGHSLSWRGAGIGKIAEALVHGKTASPLFLLDEIDKVPSHHTGDRPLDVLHSLLEEENAAIFTDGFLKIPLRADQVLWIATANDISMIPASILDRTLIIHVPAPSPEERRAILRRMITAGIALFPGMGQEIGDEILDAFAFTSSARALKRIIRLACGYAIADDRTHLQRDDLTLAAKHCLKEQSDHKQVFGFLTPLGPSRSHDL